MVKMADEMLEDEDSEVKNTVSKMLEELLK